MTRRPRILVTAPIHTPVSERLRAVGEVTVNFGEAPWAQGEVARLARDHDAVMAFMPDRFDAAFFVDAGRLKMIACALKGYDNFDVAAATRVGVRLSIVPDLLTEPTAELAIGLAIGLARHIRAGDAIVREGRFEGWRPVLYGIGLAGATVAVVGMGQVGRAIVDRLAGFGCAKIFGVDPRSSDARVEMQSLDAVAARAEIVILAAPLTPETQGLIGPHYLQCARNGQLIVNVGRGSVVDEEALVIALGDGRIGGYAADVFAFEDWNLADRPRAVAKRLRDHPATLFTPHLGSAVASVRLAIEHRAADNILAFLLGREPPDIVVEKSSR